MDKKGSFYTIFFVIVICFVFGLGISLVHNLTADMLKKNEALHKNRVLCNAFMIDVDDNPKSYALAVKNQIDFEEITDGSTLRQVYKYKPNELKSENDDYIGFSFSGIGFWDEITGVIVLSKDLNKIKHIQFFEQKETPGLGARIEEKWFTDQFKGIDINWNKPISKRIIIESASGSKKHNKIDSITGATQTSMALKRILNNELERIRNLVFD